MSVTGVLYAPVLHQGYLALLERWAGAVDRCYLLGDDLIEELSRGGRREIREVAPVTMLAALRSATDYPPAKLDLLTHSAACEIGADSAVHVIMPELAICRRFAQRYLVHTQIEWDSVFLQWDEAQVISQAVVAADYSLSYAEFDQRMITLARGSADGSSDWWRHVGAVLVRDGQVVTTAFNHHVPTEQTQYVNGDPRDFVTAGSDSHIATALHAEQSIITQAARLGVPLQGCELYVPVFPCPMCAKQIAYSGIRKVYFAEGHASLDGETILKSQNIDIVLVQ